MVKELVPVIFGFSLCFSVGFRLIDSSPVYRRIDKMSIDIACPLIAMSPLTYKERRDTSYYSAA